MATNPLRLGSRILVACALVAVVLAIAVPVAMKRAPQAPNPSPRPGHDNRGGGGPGEPGSATESSRPDRPSVFRFYQESPTTLDPALASDAYSSTVIAQIYSPLVGLTSSLEPTPQVADSWTISRDGLTYVFHIREGVRFHHGREVTAHDFAFSLTRLFKEPFLSEGLAAGYLDAIDGVSEFLGGKSPTIRGIRALDNRHLEVRLARPYRPLLTALALDQTSAVPQELIERYGNAVFEVEPMGCGPYRYVRREGERGVVLAANKDYFMGRPAIDSLVFYAPPGDVVEMGAEALLEGKATLSALPANRVEEFRARSGITLLRWQDLSLGFIGMNATIPPLNDSRVRRAVALAADRHGMLALQPEGKTLALGILPPGLPGYTPGDKTYARDLSRARALLAEAGYGPAKPLPPIRLYKSVTSNLKTRQMDALLVASLKEAGIKVETEYVTWSQLDDLITKRKAPMFNLSWVADIPDPDTFLRALFYSTSSTNYFRYSSASVDSLLDRARAADDPVERQRAYERAEAIILRDAAFVPTYHPASFIGIRDNVVGLEMNPLGISTLAMEKLRFSTPRRDDGDRRTAAR
jgi:peptide/nickel transport system substrate-binding protein/oligopeptide transport system substrate-binding protein